MTKAPVDKEANGTGVLEQNVQAPFPAEEVARQHNQEASGRGNDGDVMQKRIVVAKGNGVTNLSDSSLNPQTQQPKSDLRHKKKFYSDSNLMNDALVGKQVESFKLKLKERQAEKTWAHLTTANLQTLTQSQEPTSKQHSFQRIRRWVQDSSPPYEANPSPGISSLTMMPPAQESCGLFRLFGCFR